MAMETSDYWAERFRALEESTHEHSQRWIKETAKQFRKAEETLKDHVSRFYHRFENLTGLTYTDARKALSEGELKAFKLTVEDYIKLGESLDVHFDLETLKMLQTASLRVRISRLEALECFIQAELARLYGEFDRSMFDYMGETYENRYYQTSYELSGLGFSFSKLNKNQIKIALEKPWRDGNFSDTIWENMYTLQKNLTDLITQSVIVGRSFTETGVLLEKRMRTGGNNCARIISTEMAAIASKAQQDMFTDYGLNKYVIVATLDDHTCQICQSLDGKVFKSSERIIGKTAPPFHPNCRTTTAPYFDDMPIRKRIARKGGTGRNELVPNQTYEEWAKANDVKPIYGLWEAPKRPKKKAKTNES